MKKGIRRKKIAVRGLVQLARGVLIYYYFFTAPAAFYRHFVPALLLHTALLCINVHINGRCVVQAQSSLL